MYLIFLDIDGVLNHGYDPSRVQPSTEWGGPDLDAGFDYCVESCVNALNALIRATGAKIVISSSWRYKYTLDELRNILHDQFGVEGDIIAVTPDDVLDAARIAEIRVFLDLFAQKVLGFVIIDDNDITLDINSELCYDPDIQFRFVRTNTTVGLTPEIAIQAAHLLAIPYSLSTS